MALYNTQGGNSVVDAGGTTLDSASITVPSGSVCYAIVVSSDGTAVDCTGVSLNPTGTPQAFTQLGSTLNLNANCRASLWRLTNATGVTAVVRATWGSNQTERSIGVWVGTDINLGTPNETPVTATGTNTTPTATANTGIIAGDLVLSFGVYQWATATPLAFNSPSGTERGEYTTAGYSGTAFQEQTAAGSSVSPQWTLSSTPVNWGIFVVALNDGGVAVGRADETDTAFALTAFIPVPGRADEVDTAFALLPTNFADDGELFIFGDDSSFESSMGGLRVFGGFPAAGSSINVGRADETDTAFARGITLAAGLASETDTAFARTFSQSRAVGLSTETDTALARTFSQSRAVGRADETDTAFARGITLATGRADETDTALALDLNAGLSVGTAVETDTAFARGITLATGRAVETDTAFALTFSQSRAVGLATETDTALQLASAQSRATGRADETDTAFALALGGPVSITVGRADETDTAFALDRLIPAPVQGPGTFQDFAAAGGLDKKPVKREPRIRAPKVVKAPKPAKAPTVQIAPPVAIDCGTAIEVDQAFALRALERVGGLYRTPVHRTKSRGVEERIAALENEVRTLRRAIR